MKRPLIIVIAGQILGILWGLYFKKNIVPIFFLPIILLAILKKFNKYKIIILIFFISMIISVIQINYLEKKFEKLYIDLDEVEVVGIVISDRKDTTYKSQYTIKVESINRNIKFKRTNLIIYVKKGLELQYGKKIKFNRNI